MTTLSYETCKRLKEVGFPQYMPYVVVCSKCLVKMQKTSKNSLKVKIHECKKGGENFVLHVPTLSELIEACTHSDYGFESLTRYTDGWEATEYNQPEHKRYIGSTPEEAVAELYIALKSK